MPHAMGRIFVRTLRNVRIVPAIILFLAATAPVSAIGKFSLGASVGYQPNPNNIMFADPMDAGEANVRQVSDYIAKTEFYNRLIHTSDGKGEQLGNPIAIPFGINLRYNINEILLRVGLEHSSLVFGGSGSITPTGGSKNIIDIHTTQTTVPVSIGFIFAKSSYHRFFFAFGPMYAHSTVTVTNSKPTELQKVLPSDQQGFAYHSFDYSGDGMGFHYILGLEMPMTPTLTFTIELMGAWGQTAVEGAITKETVNSSKFRESRGQNINFGGHRVLFGINYIIEI